MMDGLCAVELSRQDVAAVGMHLPVFRRSFALSVHASVAEKSFLQLRCRDSYHDGSYCPPIRVISGTTATNGLCSDYLGRPSKSHVVI